MPGDHFGHFFTLGAADTDFVDRLKRPKGLLSGISMSYSAFSASSSSRA